MRNLPQPLCLSLTALIVGQFLFTYPVYAQLSRSLCESLEQQVKYHQERRKQFEDDIERCEAGNTEDCMPMIVKNAPHRKADEIETSKTKIAQENAALEKLEPYVAQNCGPLPK